MAKGLVEMKHNLFNVDLTTEELNDLLKHVRTMAREIVMKDKSLLATFLRANDDGEIVFDTTDALTNIHASHFLIVVITSVSGKWCIGTPVLVSSDISEQIVVEARAGIKEGREIAETNNTEDTTEKKIFVLLNPDGEPVGPAFDRSSEAEDAADDWAESHGYRPEVIEV